jgi:hypothetical protein
MWSYREDLSIGGRDLVGYDVEATDGKIGTIDEASNEAGTSYVVVDTGFWIFGKKRMIPAGVIRQVSDDDRKVYVSMTKDEIKDAPDFEESHRELRDDEVYDYYAGYGKP